MPVCVRALGAEVYDPWYPLRLTFECRAEAMLKLMDGMMGRYALRPPYYSLIVLKGPVEGWQVFYLAVQLSVFGK